MKVAEHERETRELVGLAKWLDIARVMFHA
jgi:hypothetical protein